MRSPETFGTFASSLGLHVIEVIGKTAEVICAAECANLVICMHAKVNPGGLVAVTTRASDAALATALCEFISRVVEKMK